MLFKDGQKYTLSKEELDQLVKEFDFNRKTVTIKYAPSMWTYDEENKKNVAPPTLPILLNSQILNKDTGHMETWVYCLRPVYKKGTDIMEAYGNPKYYTIKRRRNIERDAELLFFLAYKSTMNAGNKAIFKEQKNGFVIDLPAKEARESHPTKMQEARKSFLVLDTDNGLDFESIKGIAEAFFIPETLMEDEELLRQELDRKVKTKEQLALFYRLTQPDADDMEIRTLVNRAFKTKVLDLDRNEFKVYWCDADGNRMDGLKKLNNAANYMEETITHFKTPAAQKKLKSILQERGISISTVQIKQIGQKTNA